MIPFVKVPGKDEGEIKLFALSYCPWCKKTKEFLNSHGIAYEYVDVDTLPEAQQAEAEQQAEKYNPEGTFPTIVINGTKVVVGYKPELLKELAAA